MTAEPLPVLYPFRLYRGDTRSWEHRFTDDPVAPATVGDPIDISLWDFLSQYRLTTETDDPPVAVDDCVIVDGPGGVMRRTLTHTEAAKLPKGRVVWDLEITKPDTTVRTYLYNPSVRCSGDVSR